MDQKIFSGVGNILRNEALYRAGIHPLSITSKIPAAKITRLVKETVKYAQLFYHELETDERTPLPYISSKKQLHKVFKDFI